MLLILCKLNHGEAVELQQYGSIGDVIWKGLQNSWKPCHCVVRLMNVFLVSLLHFIIPSCGIFWHKVLGIFKNIPWNWNGSSNLSSCRATYWVTHQTSSALFTSLWTSIIHFVMHASSCVYCSLPTATLKSPMTTPEVQPSNGRTLASALSKYGDRRGRSTVHANYGWSSFEHYFQELDGAIAINPALHAGNITFGKQRATCMRADRLSLALLRQMSPLSVAKCCLVAGL